MKMTTLWSPEVDIGSRGRQRHVLLALGERSMVRGRKEVPVVMEPFLTRWRRSKKGGGSDLERYTVGTGRGPVLGRTEEGVRRSQRCSAE
jgi:hypothetical protein